TSAFAAMEATSASGISRPFDARRDGFVMGEGAGVLVLEEKEAAEKRGATILGEVTGYGVTADAHHLTAPQPEGEAEAKAIKAALGERAMDIPVSSTKSSIGHLLGAAGAVEAIATIEALRRREAPPTVGYEEAEEGLDLDYVEGSAKPIVNGDGSVVAISNSFGFGGHNAVLVLSAN